MGMSTSGSTCTLITASTALLTLQLDSCHLRDRRSVRGPEETLTSSYKHALHYGKAKQTILKLLIRHDQVHGVLLSARAI